MTTGWHCYDTHTHLNTRTIDACIQSTKGRRARTHASPLHNTQSPMHNKHKNKLTYSQIKSDRLVLGHWIAVCWADNKPTQKLHLPPISLRDDGIVSFWLSSLVREIKTLWLQGGGRPHSGEKGWTQRAKETFGSFGVKCEGKDLIFQKVQPKWRTLRCRVTELGCCSVCVCVSYFFPPA